MGTRGGPAGLNDGPTRPPSLAALGRSSSLSSTGSNSSVTSASSALAARFQQQDAEQVGKGAACGGACGWGVRESDRSIDRGGLTRARPPPPPTRPPIHQPNNPYTHTAQVDALWRRVRREVLDPLEAALGSFDPRASEVVRTKYYDVYS
jgi:hypothetical protein